MIGKYHGYIIISIWSWKTTLTKKFNRNINLSKFQFPIQPDPRSNEVNGVDYHFVSKDNFEKLLKNNKFYEHAKIFGNYYGTLKEMLIKPY